METIVPRKESQSLLLSLPVSWVGGWGREQRAIVRDT